MPDPVNYTAAPASSTAFIGLQSYSEAQADQFFGRAEETDTLTKLIKSNILTIVFGKSGTGKTSLLNAGVFPRLRKEYCLPFRIRLEFGEKSPGLITQVKKILKQEIDKYGFRAEAYPADETLWEYFHKEPLWKTVTPVLIFDQFEEIFTLAKNNPRFSQNEMTAFWDELSDVIENSIPEKLKEQFLNRREQVGYNYKQQKAKVLFSFREEYLPEFESIAAKIPSLKYSRFRLLPMNGQQAYEVITKTWKENIYPAEAKKIVSYLTKEAGRGSYDLMTVEPSLLSQVCAYIDEKRIEESSQKVSAELLIKYPQETILRSIYDEAIAAADEAMPGEKNPKEKIKKNLIKEFVEEKLINADGNRTRYNLSEDDDYLKPGIGVLQNKYFIREENKTAELTHDVLAPLIKTDREKRRKEAERIAYRKKVIKRALKWVVPLLLIAGGVFAFLSIRSADAKRDLDKFIYAMEFKMDSLENVFLIKHKKKVDAGKSKDGTENETTDKNLLSLLNQRIAGLVADSANLANRITRLVKDSAELADSVSGLANDISVLREALAKKEAEIKILARDTAILKETIRIVRITIRTKTKEYDDLKKKYDSLKTAYDTLFAKYNVLLEKEKTIRKEIADSIREINYPPSPCPLIDKANSLELKIYYTQSQTYYPGIRPESINIYMIPYHDENIKTIRRAKVYDYYYFNEPALENAKGSIKSKYCDGAYYFTNVAPGKYLVKVCTLYGAYKDYVVVKGNERLVIDAVPPVR